MVQILLSPVPWLILPMSLAFRNVLSGSKNLHYQRPKEALESKQLICYNVYSNV